MGRFKKVAVSSAAENDTMVGVQAYVIVPSIGRMWDGFIHMKVKRLLLQ